MKFLYSDEPIIACSTGNQSNAAMAVIRISGFKDFAHYRHFFELKNYPIEPRRVYYTALSSQGMHLDDVCLTYFESPYSYNGENILELSVHGNTLNVDRIISLFTDSGLCREAAPGEFTFRALKNKKLSLSQVEGLDLFLNANSGFALDQGLSLLNGELQRDYQDLLELFLNHKAALELSIDFLEDIGEEGAQKQFEQTLKLLFNKYEAVVRRARPMEQNLIHPEIVLAGLPNSGKSSLFNFLLSQDRAIVSSIPGTTRDYLSETLVIEGVKYRIVDTAGVRESEDFVEAEGIRRTRKKLYESFFSILLINPFLVNESLVDLLQHRFDRIFFTHADCPDFEVARNKLIVEYPELGPMGAINLLELERSWEVDLYRDVNKKYLKLSMDKPILLSRHKSKILQGKGLLDKYIKTSTYEMDVAVLSSELNAFGHCISELIGIISPDQILNSIFTNFCIGK